jgi:hypothetical protein
MKVLSVGGADSPADRRCPAKNAAAAAAAAAISHNQESATSANNTTIDEMSYTALLAEIMHLRDDVIMVKDDIKTLFHIAGKLERGEEWARVVAATEQSMMIKQNDVEINDMVAASNGDFAMKRKHPRKKNWKKTGQKKDDVHKAVVKYEDCWGGFVAGVFAWMILLVSVSNFALGIMGGGEGSLIGGGGGSLFHQEGDEEQTTPANMIREEER